MYNGKRFLAIIPARSGSKGLKDKNIKLLDGKPLISYTINTARSSEVFDYIMVSTDSEKYAEIAIREGANIPFLRSKELSTDVSSSVDVILDAIEKIEKMGMRFDYFVLLQPTSPLRDCEDITNSVKILFEKEANSVVSVCESDHSPVHMNKLDKSLSMMNFIMNDNNKRRQDMDLFYRINGAIYICDVEYFKNFRKFYGEKSYAYIMKKINSVDIDDELDFLLAQTILKYKNYVIL